MDNDFLRMKQQILSSILGSDEDNIAYRANQERMRQWAGGPVKQQNKQMKNDVMFGKYNHNTDPADYLANKQVERSVSNAGDYELYPRSQTTTDPLASKIDVKAQNRVYVDDPYAGYSLKPRTRNILGEKIGLPKGALPMVAPEALGMYGAAQEAQRKGVNPMVNWLQRMTPVPIVAPTGNGGEVYNYQTGERYTPEY